MGDEHPNTLIRRIINVLAATLNCDLVCVLRRKDDHEMLVTPHANRSLESLRANLVSRDREQVLEPFFSQGSPVFCASVSDSCPQDGFFGQVQRISQFAFVPAGQGVAPEYALLMAWSDPNDSIGPRTMPLLRVAANLLGSVLLRLRLVSEMEQEKDILRRYTRLTAGREVRMADLKRENAGLRELVMKLGNKDKE
jgi:transcriptional regulator with GAF, ATPase, and Fis domain